MVIVCSTIHYVSEHSVFVFSFSYGCKFSVFAVTLAPLAQFFNLYGVLAVSRAIFWR